jgi:hypothetical protein
MFEFFAECTLQTRKRARVARMLPRSDYAYLHTLLMRSSDAIHAA